MVGISELDFYIILHKKDFDFYLDIGFRNYHDAYNVCKVMELLYSSCCFSILKGRYITEDDKVFPSSSLFGEMVELKNEVADAVGLLVKYTA